MLYLRLVSGALMLLTFTALNGVSAQDISAQREGNESDQQDLVPCGAGKWTLKGAGANAEVDDNVTYDEEWTPVLKEIVQCLAEPSMERACVKVRGHSDQLSFSPAVVNAFGSVEAAQLARARSRGLIVEGKLHALGVDPQRLVLLPPSSKATYRGVEIYIEQNCLGQKAPSLPDWMNSPETVGQALRDRGIIDEGTNSEPVIIEKTVQVPKEELYPETAFWFGLRGGMPIPLGKIYKPTNSEDVESQDIVDIGAGFEMDAGMRFKKRFILFAFWQRQWLNPGSDPAWRDFGGGQVGEFSDYWGIGGRFDYLAVHSLGFHVDAGLGYHLLQLKFSDDTKMRFASPLEVRFGVGMGYRFSPKIEVVFDVLVSGGAYSLRKTIHSDSSQSEMGGESRFHSTLGFMLGSHFDIAL